MVLDKECSIAELLVDHPLERIDPSLSDRKIRPSGVVVSDQEGRGRGERLTHDGMVVAAFHQDRHGPGQGMQALLAMAGLLPAARHHIGIPIHDVARVVIDQPRVDAARAEHHVGRHGVLAGEVAELRRAGHQGQELGEVRADMLGTDQIGDVEQRRVIRPALVVVHPGRVVVDQGKVLGRRLADVLPECAIGARRHRHEIGMTDVGAENSVRGRELQPVDHAAGVGPGHPDHGRETESRGLVGERRHDLLELIELEGVELAIAVGRIDAMRARGVQAPDVLAEDALVKAVVLVEGRRHGRPDAMQIFTGQPFGH